MQKIGFIGAGNMGGAMIHAIATKHCEEILIYDVNKENYRQFEKENVIPLPSIQAVVEKAQYIVLTIKPQYYEQVLDEIKLYLKKDQIIITVAPGYTIERVKTSVGTNARVIRTMPNTPALVGKGITAYCYDKETIKDEEVQVFLSYFTSFGRCIKIVEEQMEAVVAVTGSSPAYAYMFIEAMADAAVRFGISRNMAYEMSAIAIQGACEMVLQTGKCPGELKDAVASPGGTTIEAIVTLEEEGFRNSVIKAMTACYDKAKAMNEN